MKRAPRVPSSVRAALKRAAAVSDRELEAGSRAHYEDAAYYASLYRSRIDDVQFYVDLAASAAARCSSTASATGASRFPSRGTASRSSASTTRAPMLADLRARLAARARGRSQRA